jgi:hypothetical protein
LKNSQITLATKTLNPTEKKQMLSLVKTLYLNGLLTLDAGVKECCDILDIKLDDSTLANTRKALIVEYLNGQM